MLHGSKNPSAGGNVARCKLTCWEIMGETGLTLNAPGGRPGQLSRAGLLGLQLGHALHAVAAHGVVTPTTWQSTSSEPGAMGSQKIQLGRTWGRAAVVEQGWAAWPAAASCTACCGFGGERTETTTHLGEGLDSWARLGHLACSWVMHCVLRLRRKLHPHLTCFGGLENMNLTLTAPGRGPGQLGRARLLGLQLHHALHAVIAPHEAGAYSDDQYYFAAVRDALNAPGRGP